MDLRFVAVFMAVVIIMDMLGRMAKKRVAEQQGPPGEEWDMLESLPEAEELPRPVAREAPAARAEQVMGGFELWSETPSRPGVPHAVEREPAIEPARQAPTIQDRPARPIVVRSRDPRPSAPRPERAAPEEELVVLARQLPASTRRRSARATISRRTRAADSDGRLGLGTPSGLRNAIVAREVLGPPVALRDDRDGMT